MTRSLSTPRPVAATAPPAQVLDVRAATRLLVGLLAALAVLTTAVAAHWSPLMRLDHAVAQRAYDATHGHPALADAWRALGFVTEPIGLRVLMAVAGLVLLWRGRRFLGGWLVGVAVLEQLVGPYAKYLLDRPRPHWPQPLEVLDTSSYPAGHATGIACLATAVVLLALALPVADRTRVLVLALTGVLVGLVCADRLLLGLHYVSDVVGGLLLGVATTVVCWLVALLVARHASGRVSPPSARR